MQACYVNAQPRLNSDSLVAVIKKMKDDSMKAAAWRDCGLKSESSSANFSKFCYSNAIDLSRRLKINEEECLSRLQFAGLYINTNNYDSAEYWANTALELAKSYQSKVNEARSYNIIGNAYRRRSQYPKALENYLKAVSIFEKQNDFKRTALVYSGIAAVFAETNESDKAISYGEKGILFALKSKDPEALAKCYFNTGAAYSITDDVKYIEYYKKGIPYALQTGNVVLIQQGYYNIANGYYQIGLEKKEMPKQASYYADSSLSWAQKTNNPLNIFYASNISAQIQIINNDLSKANQHIKIAASALNEVGNNFTKRIYYSTLASLRYKQGLFKEAYDSRLLQDAFKDSVLNEERLDAQRELEAKYELQNKETQLQLQKATIKEKKTWNYLFGGSAAALALIAFLVYRSYRNKHKVDQLRITELETEKQLAATEAVLKGEEQERTRLAKDLHDGLGGMLSGIKHSFNNMKGNLVMTPDNVHAFERSMDMLDNSIKELRRVAHNMMPESLLRYGLDKAMADYLADINKTGVINAVYQSLNLTGRTFDNTTTVTIYRIVQELVNNAIKHAGAKQVLVQLFAEENNLIVNVEDDGKGFDVSKIQDAGGIGWKNIRSRVDFLKGKLDINSKEGNGTSVSIVFNI